MTKKTELLKQDIVDSMKSYIKENGIKLSDDFYYWNNYPLVVQDKCVSFAVVNNENLQFGDFENNNIAVENFICKKTPDDFSSLASGRKMLDGVYTAMKIVDGKKLIKQW